MARLKIKLTEMKNADVRFLSLVQRGANRIPFRVIKSLKEPEMLDLTSIRRMKSDKPVPTVVGLVVNSSDDAFVSAVSEAVKAAGYSAENVIKYEDGTAMFAQGEVPEDGEGVLIRLSDDLVVVLKNADEFAETLSDASALSKSLQAEGFFFGPTVATQAMQEAMGTVMKSEGDKTKAIKTMTEQYQAYMGALSALIPANVLALEDGIGGAVKKAEAAKSEADKAAADAATAAATAEAEKASKEKQEPEGSAAEEAGETAAQEAAEQQKKQKSETEQLLAAIAGLTEAVNAVKSEVAGVKESQSKLEARVEETAQKAEKADKAVSSTVVASAVKGDEPHGVAEKSDGDPRSGYYDTAFMKRRK